MYTRLFYGTIQPGRADEVWAVFDDIIPKVKAQGGSGSLHVLQSGDEIVGISTWETQQALAAYVDGDLARELFERLTPLLMGKPTSRSYEVRMSA
jgi:quinol monooxygenase YgiN